MVVQKPNHRGSKLANETRIGWPLSYDNSQPHVGTCVMRNPCNNSRKNGQLSPAGLAVG
jgi:hypothetical protein